MPPEHTPDVEFHYRPWWQQKPEHFPQIRAMPGEKTEPLPRVREPVDRSDASGPGRPLRATGTTDRANLASRAMQSPEQLVEQTETGGNVKPPPFRVLRVSETLSVAPEEAAFTNAPPGERSLPWMGHHVDMPSGGNTQQRELLAAQAKAIRELAVNLIPGVGTLKTVYDTAIDSVAGPKLTQRQTGERVLKEPARNLPLETVKLSSPVLQKVITDHLKKVLKP